MTLCFTQKIIFSFVFLTILSLGGLLYIDMELSSILRNAMSLLEEQANHMQSLEPEQVQENFLVERDYIYAEFLEERRHIVVFIALFLVFSIFTSAFLYQGLIKPVKSLTAYLMDNEEIQRLFHVPFQDRKDEIGDLAQSFQTIIDARNKAEEDMRKQARDYIEAKIVADQANKAKSIFLAQMSHELRTPLNSIIGIMQLIDPDKLDEDTFEKCALVKQSSHNLLAIVNDILDISKIEANRFDIDSRPFDVGAQIKKVTQSLEPLAREKNLDFSCHHKIEPLYAMGDPLLFSRILTNLISNAINYTKVGGITIRFMKEDIYEGQIGLRCEVTDTGIGIQEDKLDTIFEKFTQADISNAREYGGTGLGLAITKELVDLMDGEIGVESTVGKGSTFWFELPYEVIDTLPEEKIAEETVRGLSASEDFAQPVECARVLMAEDHPMNVSFMKKFFEDLNIKNYRIVENGFAAVEALQSDNYDVILMDCHMPVMNGYDATAMIRHMEDPWKREIPIIAMTANAMPEDEKKCVSAGMNAYISKPVDKETFKKKLSSWIIFENDNNPAMIASSDPTTIDRASPADLTILINNAMGDDDFIKEMIGLFISQAQQQVNQLKKQCTDGPNTSWVEISHSIKGTAGHVGAEKMRQLCAASQEMADASAKKRRKISVEIEKEYMKVKEYLVQRNLY